MISGPAAGPRMIIINAVMYSYDFCSRTKYDNNNNVVTEDVVYTMKLNKQFCKRYLNGRIKY